MTNHYWPGADSVRAARLDFDPDDDGFDYITFRAPTCPAHGKQTECPWKGNGNTPTSPL